MWNKHIYLTRNSVETNTHVSTLHSMIQLVLIFHGVNSGQYRL